MFTTSRDILNLALTLSVVVISFFIAWLLYYIVMMFKEMHKVVRDVTKALEKMNDVLDFAKEKIASAAAVLPIIIKAGEKVMDMIASRRDKRETRDENKQRKTKNNNETDF